jgi:hypothetical protein
VRGEGANGWVDVQSCLAIVPVLPDRRQLTGQSKWLDPPSMLPAQRLRLPAARAALCLDMQTCSWGIAPWVEPLSHCKTPALSVPAKQREPLRSLLHVDKQHQVGCIPPANVTTGSTETVRVQYSTKLGCESLSRMVLLMKRLSERHVHNSEIIGSMCGGTVFTHREQ